MEQMHPSSDAIQAAFPVINSLQFIKSGGFKHVYSAEFGGKKIALKLAKIPIPEGAEKAEAFRTEVLGRVQRELKILNKCISPEIVKLEKIGPALTRIEGAEYIAYAEEFLEGEDLCRILRAKPAKPDEGELRLLFISLLKVVKELWSYEYVHRDIKPDNVIKLNNPKRPFVVLDFGIAYSFSSTPLTVDPCSPPMTLRYAAPEMLNMAPQRNYDYRVDLYSSALTVFEYAAQEHPLVHDFDDPMMLWRKAKHNLPLSLYHYRNDLSKEFCALIDGSLKKNPNLRPARIEVLIEQLEKK